MTTQIQDQNGNVIARSKNLRGILDRARRFTVDEVHCHELRPFASDLPEYSVEFHYSDKSIGFATFASWRVLAQFIRSRRSWRVNRILGHKPFLAELATYMAGQPH